MPTAAHFLYIPGILLIGIVIGWILGTRAAADAYAAERRKRIEEALASVGLASRMKHFPAELSGGQQQRAAIARALAGSPRLLLADEPTGNLDSQMARGVMELMEDINAKGTTIVMVTHDPELAARAQRNVHIVDGMATDLSVEPSLRRVATASLSESNG